MISKLNFKTKAFVWERFDNRIDFATVTPVGRRFNGRAYKAAFFNGNWAWYVPGLPGGLFCDDVTTVEKTSFYANGKKIAQIRHVTCGHWDLSEIDKVIDVDLFATFWAKKRLRAALKNRLAHVFKCDWKQIKAALYLD